MTLDLGFYECYKKIYELITEGFHVESGEIWAIYKDELNRVWIRPLESFKENFKFVSKTKFNLEKEILNYIFNIDKIYKLVSIERKNENDTKIKLQFKDFRYYCLDIEGKNDYEIFENFIRKLKEII